MSLYSVQKVLFQLNNDATMRRRYDEQRDAVLAEYPLTEEERRALAETDVGRLHLLGVHPLLLAPFAGRSGLKWPDYLAALQRARDAETQATAHPSSLPLLPKEKGKLEPPLSTRERGGGEGIERR